MKDWRNKEVNISLEFEWKDVIKDRMLKGVQNKM